MSRISTAGAENSSYADFLYATQQINEAGVDKSGTLQSTLGRIGVTAAVALCATPTINAANLQQIPENNSSIRSFFGRVPLGTSQIGVRWEGLVSNIVPGATPESGIQLASFFKAMPQADRRAVVAILQDVQKVFLGSIEELELEHNFDYETSKNQLFVSVETGLSTKDILEKRNIFNKIILSDDAKKAASKYTITTFF